MTWNFTLLILPAFFLAGCGSKPESASGSESITSTTAHETAPADPKAHSLPANQKAIVALKPKAHYGMLTIDAVQQSGGSAALSGSTDLPDGSMLKAGIELYTSDPDSTYIGNSADVTVKQGKWTGTVPFPKVAGFVKGPHEAEVLFTPKSQSPEILALIGPNGERLKGSNVEKAFDFYIVKVTKRVRLSGGKRQASMPDPHAYTAEDPRHALATLLTDWKAKRWTKIAEDGILTHNANLSKRREWVDSQFGFRDLESASIGAVRRTGLAATVSAQVAYSLGSDLRRVTMNFVFLRSDAHGNPDPRGKWRGNFSLIGQDGS